MKGGRWNPEKKCDDYNSVYS